MTTLIRNGTVVPATDMARADVLIDGERIQAIGTGLAQTGTAAAADTVIEAAGRYVMPGGIDVHTHMELPFGGTFASDDFATGTVAAAWGGTTTIVDFAVQSYGETLAQGLDRWLEKAGPKSHIDYGLTRPSSMEGEATHRAIALAELAGVPVYIVHLSSREALSAVREGRSRGVPAYAETCPQYLYLSLDDLARPGFEGAKFVCSPPLRPAYHQADLWRGLVTDDLQVVSTDHCPFHYKDQTILRKDDFSAIPNGLPGVEDRYTLLWDGGVAAGHISPTRFVELIATAPARMFGLYPRKGTLAPGADADVVVFNPGAERTLSATTHHMRVDSSCYEGRKVRGQPEVHMQRGNVLVRDGKFLGQPGAGRFLERSRFGPAPAPAWQDSSSGVDGSLSWAAAETLTIWCVQPADTPP